MNRAEQLTAHLRQLRLVGFRTHHEALALTADKQGWSFGRYLHELTQIELQERVQRRTQRYLKQSELPLEKTLDTLKMSCFPSKVKRTIQTLCEGEFLQSTSNILLFGLPGRGKTHIACAIGHELIRRGHRVLFVSTAILVQRLLAAKKDIRLEQLFKKLDRFDVIILDDLGYVQQSEEEMKVLFTFLAERYERRSVILTSNLVFSEWERIFKDPMTTNAAIDRLVHHSVVLMLEGPSYREQEATRRTGATP